jgi:hypothetical protein
MTVITTKAISSSIVSAVISQRTKRGPSPNTSAVPSAEQSDNLGGVQTVRYNSMALPEQFGLCGSGLFGNLFSPLQLSNPANVIFRIAPPFGSSPPVVSARLLGPGWSPLPWPFLLAALPPETMSKKGAPCGGLGPRWRIAGAVGKRRLSTRPLKRPDLIVTVKWQ